MAIQSAVEFFKNLPPKLCSNCQQEVNEMHDCYTHKCEKCEAEENK
ncbi:YhfH family protein [Anaerobacillus alkalidiazotrophicus]|uniref:YhfH family protein n=1 Tax=Anaerobacillus alkalidiazotrophicus TaxID=472963 RepID=A0A1S2M353_9BACI|nr:protein YhfH [Anaerobacillus alkalidiazotrophicus]OIJ18960.1 YhfH family protein [Anaerobacillus alkalidiazotrophicus]